MTVIEETKVFTEEILGKNFQEHLIQIGDYLNKTIPKELVSISMQEEESEICIPDLGKKFGVHYTEQGDIILAKWLNDSSAKERKILIDYLLSREVFRIFLNQSLPINHQYERFTDIIIHVMTILWTMNEYNYNLQSAPIIAINGRADAFEEEEILRSEYWVYFVENCYQLKINSKAIFDIVIEKTDKASEEKKPLYDLAWEIMRWMKSHIPELVHDGLPLYIKKKRHYELIKFLAEISFEDSTALQLSEKIGRSHNVINIDFKQIMEEYGLYWWPEINNLKLRLYPFLIRIDLLDEKYKETIYEKLKTINYLIQVMEGKIGSEGVIIGWLESPLIVSEHLIDFFEKLKRKGLIKNYFVKQIRRKQISWSITNKKLELKKENFKQLLHFPEKMNFHSVRALDREYQISGLKKKKSEVFHKDILMFISTIMYRNLGKAHYKFKPIEVIYELCEENKVDSKNTSDVLYFINQMEIRCRRLQVLDYYLYFRELAPLKRGLVFDITTDSSEERLKEIISQLNFVGEMICITMIDRIVLLFPYIKIESFFKEVIEEFLTANEIHFNTFQTNSVKGVSHSKIRFDEVFDFESLQWKFQ